MNKYTGMSIDEIIEDINAELENGVAKLVKYEECVNCSPILNENPAICQIFKPEAPYGMYTDGCVKLDKKLKRRVVILWDKNGIYRHCFTSFARYYFQVYLWKKENIYISKEYEVDHINNIRLDDRVANYQLLLKTENLKKQGAICGKKRAVMICPICKAKFLREIWQTQLYKASLTPVAFCCQDHRNIYYRGKFDNINPWLSKNQILYIIRQFTDDVYTIPRSEILEYGCREMLDPLWVLTDDFGRKIQNSPKYTTLENMLEIIREMTSLKKSRQEIADYLETTVSALSQIIRKNLPQLCRQQKIEDMCNEIEILLNKRYSTKDISRELNKRHCVILSWIRKYFPNYGKKFILESKKGQIQTLLNNGCSVSEIVKETSLSQTTIDYHIRKVLPEVKMTKKRTFELKLEKIKDLLDSGKNCIQIGQEIGLAFTNVYRLANRYFKYRSPRTEKREYMINEIRKLQYEGLSNGEIAKHLGVYPYVVKNIISKYI